MAVSMGLVIALIKALAKVDSASITSAVDAWLDDHPEATTTVEDGSITYAKLATALAALLDGKQESVPATDGDVGKYLKAKTVTGGVVTEYEFGSPGGGGGGGAVDDVQVNGTSVVEDGVAKIPLAGSSLGVVKKNITFGIDINGNGDPILIAPTDAEVKSGTGSVRRAIQTFNQHSSTFYGLAKAAGDSTQSASNNNVGVYTEGAKSAISEMFNAPETVSGSTPTITAKPGVRYICGECSTLSITAPASGCIDVVFESGSTPTVLTVTSASGEIAWANDFDPDNLEAGKTYEINILDGKFGVAGVWETPVELL